MPRGIDSFSVRAELVEALSFFSATCKERTALRQAQGERLDLRLGPLQLASQLRDDLEEVTDEADVSDLEDGGVLVLVDGDDRL